MLTGLFQHRSGRVVAVGRTVLAVFFLVALWLDQTQSLLAPRETYALLGLYLAAAFLLLAVTWSNWWLESRLAGPAHGLDLLVFIWVNYATGGYASPFFIFFVFLILSASIRWGWRGTATTAGLIFVLYVGSALSGSSWGTESFELRRFALRSAYLLALSSIVVLWLAANQRPPEGDAALLDDETPRRRHPDAEALLRYAAGRFGAARALFVWTETEEPWVYAARLQADEVSEDRLKPGALQPAVAIAAARGAFLFDQESGRVLHRRGTRLRKLEVLAEPIHPAIAERYDARHGLRIPVRSGALDGDIFVLDVPGMCSDDLQLAEETGMRIAGALEQRERMNATEEAAEMRARLSLARDLHDSVVQFLAGFTFRLEGMKKAAAAGRPVDEEVEALQHELVGEQRDLRRLIAELRGTGGGEGAADLAVSLGALGRRISAQWDIDFSLAPTAGAVEVPAHIDRHVGQLVREAAANAVRHGRARSIATRLARANGHLELEISDDGSGFPVAGEFDDDEMQARRIGPLSLRERVHNLGGRLRLRSGAGGATLNITLPLEAP